MNKLIFIFLLTTTPVLLCAKKSPSNKVMGNDSAKADSLQKKSDPIVLKPLHLPDEDILLDGLCPKESSNLSSAKENNNQGNANQVKPEQQQTKKRIIINPEQWVMESSMRNAPELLKGIFFYLLSQSQNTKESQKSTHISSYHRFLLVGPPGTGKTTLAYALGHMLGCSVIFVPATNFLGRFRNETAANIKNFLREHTADGVKKVIIIDELHKLFEYHSSEHSDSSQSAAAFWLALDGIEKYSPNVIIIGTANSVDKLPPEIKSRFTGKVITVPLPDKSQKIEAFKESIKHDQSVLIDASINDKFIEYIIKQLNNGSLRDVQLIVDAAKMFYYAEKTCDYIFPIVLTRKHFEQALNQLRAESCVLQESASDIIYKKVQKWGLLLSVVVNVGTLANLSVDLHHKLPILLKKLQSSSSI